MSELPQQTDPDLHAIFGIDGTVGADAERLISVERAVRVEGLDAAATGAGEQFGAGQEPGLVFAQEGEPGAAGELEGIEGADVYASAGEGEGEGEGGETQPSTSA